MATKKEIANSYDEISDRISMSDRFYESCIEMVEHKVQGNILDIGCGQGFLLEKIFEKFQVTSVVGIDISPKLLSIAAVRNPEATILNLDAEDIDTKFAENSFDVVFITECLEHLLNPQKVLTKVSKILKSDGKLVVTVPNRGWLRYQSYIVSREIFQPVDDHFYRLNEIKKLLKQNNFKIEKIRGEDILFHSSGILRKIDRVLLLLFPILNRRMKRLIILAGNIEKNMNSDLALVFSNPLFIGKKLQRDKFREFASSLLGNVLDVGCGKKPFTEFLGCKKYLTMDLDEKVNPDVIGRATKIPFRSAVLDGAICTEVLEHVPEPASVVSEINRVLKKNGALYITVPMSWCLHYEPNDYYRFTKYGLKYLLEDNGFEVMNLERIGGIFSLIGVRFIDGFWVKFIFKLLFFLPWKIRSRVAEISAIPLNIFFYYYGRHFDQIQRIDAIDWAALARKR